ncbi:Zinc finger protein like [Verticillium longisporum]|uniref:C2H2-type domain-containing protein n=5 Tax=Verticillium TaxID=1036719 RepID=G2XK00_VERDV|nr:uncharacterized protein VDAG_10482 [Verticillium dahliae VdLs.17]KAF3349364.1 Protein CASP [Verticillium dahliae VDG2]KAF3360879.1 hypothetical protein VdG1_04840 [Verticillium dahliae VDG1]KAG7124374.1 Zinc finger protein like [Verticillium longisporum]KAH6701793.1 hypothetical protein EV126DRAFT_339385 [Verticillium dahliae]EGY21500.1 hypothetical protein VDAG_10482 [Verticillium dahliae VdLs.17]
MSHHPAVFFGMHLGDFDNATTISDEGSSSCSWDTPATMATGLEQRFACRWGECGKSFPRPSDLTKHERYHIKDYHCDEVDCCKAFATHKDLKRHKKTHEKLDGGAAAQGYRCRVPGCRKAKTGHVYNRRDNFTRHLRTKHADLDFDVKELGSG